MFIFLQVMSQQDSPIGQRLQDSGHQHTRDGLVEYGVTNSNDVHDGGGAEDREHVGWHALPKVQQEALDLKIPGKKKTMAFSVTNERRRESVTF